MEDGVKTEDAAIKMVPQSEVDKLVVGVKREAAERATREAEARYQRELEELRARTVAAPEAGIGGMPVIDSGRLKEEVLNEIRGDLEAKAREQEEAMRRERANEFVRTYEAKMELGRSQYPDFDEVVGNVDPKEFVDVIMLANETEGTADIMYELAKSPDKLVRMATAARVSNAQAKRLMTEIAQSVRINRDAQDNVTSTREPLPRSRPSTAGTSTSELKSVNDFKKQSWLRG